MSDVKTTSKSPLAGVWQIAAIPIAALLIVAPIIATLAGALTPADAGSLWPVSGYNYLRGTVLLCLLVGIGATLLGAGAAMIVSLTEFPGRRIFMIAMALPFAIPAYVAAYAYGDFFGPFGFAADVFGAHALPEIRSLPGAAFILTLMTYPYVYLSACASLSGRSAAYMEAARMLGAKPGEAAFRILLSASRPALAGGLALALMETAADYGVADYFGVQTLSVGIFRTWQGLGDLTGATQLAGALFLTALILVLLEEAGRRGSSAESVKAHRGAVRLRLKGKDIVLAILGCCVPVLFGFLLPAGVLLAKLDLDLSAGAIRGLGGSFTNSAAIAAVGAALTIALAITLAYAARRSSSVFGAVMLRIATLGYAIPGAVIAIGILALTAGLARMTGYTIAGGIAVLLYAYVARFMTAGFNAAAGGLKQISPQMDAAAQSLGAGPGRIFWKIHWPQTRGAIFAGAAIVAIDIAKELPATLLLRPFNFETLATRIYRLASDERLADAAPAALLLIALGLIPTLILSLVSSNEKTRGNREASAGETLLETQTAYSPPR